MLQFLSGAPSVFIGLSLFLGLLIGSFLNVVIHRLPRMLEREWKAQCAWLEGRDVASPPPYDLVRPRSACPRCGHLIPWFENVPVLSWLLLRGKCSACAAPISARYPLVEALTGVLFALAGWRWGVSFEVLAIWLLLSSLVALTFIDLDTQLLPDNITVPLVWIGLLVNADGLFVPLEQALVGATVGYLSLWSIYHLFRLLTGKEGMGYGDFKLLAALGAWMGWKMLLPVVLCASLAGALFGIGLILFAGHERGKPLPFGPWLAFGGIVTLFWGETMVRLWLG